VIFFCDPSKYISSNGEIKMLNNEVVKRILSNIKVRKKQILKGIKKYFDYSFPLLPYLFLFLFLMFISFPFRLSLSSNFQKRSNESVGV
jgi:hypothetical protein